MRDLTRDTEIVPENIDAVGAIYYAWQLEQAGLFQVVDRLVELWSAGLLPVGNGKGRSTFERYLRGAERRLDGCGRAALYTRCFGLPGGDPDGEPNREFDDLWLRFVRSVSAYARQQNVRREATLRTAGGDLAANLSLHGRGAAQVVGPLRRHLAQAQRVLQTGAVERAYGSHELWDVVEHVALIELGSRRDTVRHRTMAQAGGTAMRWLALRSQGLVHGRGRVVDIRSLRRAKSPTPRETPTDRDLVDACQGWLAVAGVDDKQVDEQAQPVETQRPDRETVRVVRPVVRKLLASSSAFARLPAGQQRRVTRDMVEVSAYLAQPHGVVEVDFPRFVADLVEGVFHAIVDASIEQMEAYGALIARAAETVDCFVADAITDGAARRWLCVRRPDLVALTFTPHRRGRLTLVARNRATALRRLGADLGLPRPIDPDEPKQELVLVRRARERIARDRQQLLATMVLMGINRSRPARG